MLVRDTGTGMSNEVIERLFEPFFTTKPTGQGTGLGLAVVQGIVKQSGGHISVQSKLNDGTEFTILVPATNDRPQKAGSLDRHGVHGPVQGLKTVLIVEDEAGVRRLLRSALESEGYRLLEACDADDAQQTCRSVWCPDRFTGHGHGDAGRNRLVLGQSIPSEMAGIASAVHHGLHSRLFASSCICLRKGSATAKAFLAR